MSDNKFSCPVCGQKISYDASYSGMEIPCPACQKLMTIPPAPSTAPIPITKSTLPQSDDPNRPQTAVRPAPTMVDSLTTPSAKAPSRPSTAAQATSGYSIFAMASLLCSVWVLFGFVPGIICGHRARTQMRRNPSLKGRALATAGLIISYVMLSLTLVLTTAFVSMHLYYRPVQVVRESPESLAELKTRIVDEVSVNNPSSESSHHLEGQNTETVNIAGKRQRQANLGGTFSYTMKVSPDKPMNLACQYWGSDRTEEAFDIAVDNQIIASQKLDANVPGYFFDMEYKIPTRMTRGKDHVKVEFQARANATAGLLFNCQTLKR